MSTPSSKETQNFIPVPVQTLPTRVPIPTHLFLLFTNPKTKTQELTIWRHGGHAFSDDELRSLLDSGIKEAWIQKSDIPKFRTWWLETGKKIIEARKQSNIIPPLPSNPTESSPFGVVPDIGHARDWVHQSPTNGGGAHENIDIDLAIVEAVSSLFPNPSQPKDPATHPLTGRPHLVGENAPETLALSRAFRSDRPKANPREGFTQAKDWSHLWAKLLSERGREEIPRELRLKLSRESAETLLKFSFTAMTPEHQALAESLITEAIGYFIRESLHDVAPGLESLWIRLSSLDPCAHSLRVASWSVLFALLNGKLHRPLLADLILSGIFHDVGLSTLPARTGLTPMRSHTPPEAQDYSRHVDASCKILETLAPKTLSAVTPRASKLIRQHHEKFDGRGYPSGLRGFHVEEPAQFLCMADLLLTLSEGRWDGVTRTHRESLFLLEKHESAGNFPEFFHPSLFQSLQRIAPQPEPAEHPEDHEPSEKRKDTA